ncbi:DNA-directed DNA polymerase [Coemansia sp. RSA 2322]|nr:DNA-directed DNA polymerase [Coemansia sp. RSA 2322]
MVAQFEAAKSKKKIKAAAEEPRPVEVLTDLVISFLTKDSHALRKLCEQVFAPFTELVTAAAVDAIVGVLQAREGAGGAEGGGIDAQMEALDAMDVDDDEGDDEGEYGGEEAGAGAEEVDEEVDEELRRKIQEALGSAGQGVDDTEEFDDEQMTVFDDKLAEIFQHKKQARTAARDLRISFGNFKLRVLDLAEVFLSRQSDSGLAIRVIRAVVDLARATRRDARSKAIHDRAVAVLVARRSRTPVGASVDVAEAAALLAFVHESARRAADKAEQRGLGAAAAVATRALLDAGAGDAVAAQCAATVRDFMTRQASQIHVDFFRVAGAKLHGAQWAVVWHAAAAAVREFGRPRAALNVFRQVQAYALAEVAAGSAAALAADADADVVAGAAGALVGGVRSAVLAVAEEVAAGSAAIDRSRLREIIELALAVFRRCVRCDGAMRAAALQALAPDAAWAAAMPALAACDGVRASTTVVRLCATLGSVDEWAAAIKPAKKREQQ